MNNEAEACQHGVIGPQVSESGRLYFSWTTGGLERSSFWSLDLGTSSFENVIKAMLASDRTAAIDAFVAALKSENPHSTV